MRPAQVVVLALTMLRAQAGRAALVVVSLALALGLPSLTTAAALRVESHLMSRARSSPLLVGAVGSPYELTLSALYFRGGGAPSLPQSTVHEIHARGYGVAAPIRVGHRAMGRPLVGTSLDYFALRGLTVAQGRLPAAPGEVVAGAHAGVAVGDTLRSDTVPLYDLVGAQAVPLVVVGVLAASRAPDDRVLFTDLLTLRAIEGDLHVHGKRLEGEDPSLDPLFLSEELTPERLARGHLHGARDAAKVTAVLVAPRDARARDQLLGDLAVDPARQGVIPEQVIGEVLAVILRARAVVVAGQGLIGLSSLVLAGLVLSLSIQLRRPDFALLRRLGARRSTVRALIAVEVVVLLSLAVGGAAVATVGGLALLEGWL